MAASGGYGFGIVGIGMIAEFHAQAIRAMKGGHLKCLFSRKGSPKAEELSKKYNVKLYVEDYQAFLKHPGLEIVTIATPSGAHLDPALEAAGAKKHVLTEKPLEVTLERCDAMIEACRKNKVVLGGIFPSRTGGAVRAIKRAIEEGRFGRLTVCNALIPWFRTQAYYDSSAWRGTWALDGGGALMNQSIHTMDLLQWLAGPVSEVSAYAGNLIHERIEVEDTATAAIKFESGALGVLVGSTAMYPGHAVELHITGEHGSAWLRGGDLVQFHFAKPRPQDKKVLEAYAPKGGVGGASDPRGIDFVGHQLQCENFVRSLKGKEPLMVDGQEARKAVALILGVYGAALTGKPQKFPLKATPKRSNFGKA